jgi:hypothetical protein
VILSNFKGRVTLLLLIIQFFDYKKKIDIIQLTLFSRVRPKKKLYFQENFPASNKDESYIT